MKKVLILDFPSDFMFPPIGYGGIERWLYTIAISFKKLGFKVYLSGPLWRKEVFDESYVFFEKRLLDSETANIFLKDYGIVDYLVGGHEYWHHSNYRQIFEIIAKKCFTFQHMPNPIYKDVCFDNKKHFLFCYSDEMIDRFKLQNPIKSICYTQGYKEEELPGKNKGYLVWLGRIDKEKLTHYAILAAIKLNIPIYIIGNPVYDKHYYIEYKYLFENKLVKYLGIVVGKDKMKIIGNAACAIYTIDKDYIESGVSTLGEFISSGIPCAGITWKGNDCVVEAIGNNKFGSVFLCKDSMPETEIIIGLTKSINYCLSLDRKILLKNGQIKYNSSSILQNMLNLMNG